MDDAHAEVPLRPVLSPLIPAVLFPAAVAAAVSQAGRGEHGGDGRVQRTEKAQDGGRALLPIVGLQCILVRRASLLFFGSCFTYLF